jgi:hypothetical protein
MWGHVAPCTRRSQFPSISIRMRAMRMSDSMTEKETRVPIEVGEEGIAADTGLVISISWQF